jgi:hypothetical protein|tara:strand:+ start:184 stop:387 length:204 start_codon:yes stop_codon:yes gene_type:complete
LKLAADTGEGELDPTKVFQPLKGELSIRSFSGIESGVIENEKSYFLKRKPVNRKIEIDVAIACSFDL